MSKIPSFAYFGAGCFWCTEAIFAMLKGIISVTPGYAGGTTPNPNYEAVCAGSTGHAEVVKIVFDPNFITYTTLLEVFFSMHNPTTLNQQGADVGAQYRSLILYTNPSQERLAHKAIRDLEAKKDYAQPVVTKVQAYADFYPAEISHQEYYQKHPESPYCQFVIRPKLDKLLKDHQPLVKAV